MDQCKLSHINQDCGPILVTGHTGFKGTWLTMLLEYCGAEAVGLSLPADPKSLFTRANRLGKIQEEFFDIRDERKVNNFIERIKPRVIVHLAAQSLVLESYKNPKLTFDVNVGGLVNVLNVFGQIDSAEVMLISTTDKVYENTGNGKPFTENDALRGKDPYSASKVAAENAIFAWRELLKSSSNKKILTARAGNVIGGGDFSENRLVPDLVRAFSTNSILEIRNPVSTRPWQHVLEPLSGYLLLALNLYENDSLHGESFNFGPSSHSNFSVLNLAQEMSKYWDKVAWIDESHLNINQYEAGLLKLNCDKALHYLNWRSILSFNETVKITAEWYKSYYLNPEQIYKVTQAQISQYMTIAEENNTLKFSDV